MTEEDRALYAEMKLNPAEWPESPHMEPIKFSAGDGRLRLSGRPCPVPARVLSEDEYQLLLAGFLAAGGKVATNRRPT